MGGVRQDEELVLAVVVKGKRSKRQRVDAPPVVLTAPAEWSSSAASATAPEEHSSGASPSTCGCVCVTEEEQDMALCLMLLSHGEPAATKEVDNKDGEMVVVKVNNKQARFRSRRPATDGAAASEFVYECKTCSKCFPSFQALGGHRTSHKKPRLLPPHPSSEDKNNHSNLETTTTAPPSLPPSPTPVPPSAEDTADATVLAIPVPAVPKQEPSTCAAASSSRHPRVHECSICGADFASGQALGGHMRRHRPLVPAAARDGRDDAPRMERSLLGLDLNMPAPYDDAEASVTSPRFAFAVAETQPAPLLFPAAAASTLVGCHY